LPSEGGILLYGPPGTGKTILPGVCAKSLKYPILNLLLTDVVKGEIGMYLYIFVYMCMFICVYGVIIRSYTYVYMYV
jgi:MoxR-like ATPase